LGGRRRTEKEWAGMEDEKMTYQNSLILEGQRGGVEIEKATWSLASAIVKLSGEEDPGEDAGSGKYIKAIRN